MAEPSELIEEAAPPSVEGEGEVEIHKPKRWRGFRGFLKEYLIIVVGVLTALGAEQAAEWLHWKHLAHEHEEDLRAGIVQLMGLSVERIAGAPCVRDELKRMAVALNAPGDDWKGFNPDPNQSPVLYMRTRLYTVSRAWTTAPWESAISDGALAHLPRARVATYALVYKTAEDIQLPQREVQANRAALTPLAFDRKLSATEKAQYLATVVRMDQQEALADSMARTIIRYAGRDAGLRPEPTDVARRLDGLRKDQNPDCVREVDVEAIIKTGVITFNDGSTLDR